MWDLITDNDSVEGKLVTTIVTVAIAIVVGTVVGRVSARRFEDRYRKYYARKISHYVVATLTLIGLGILWRPFAGQLGLVLGLTAAGIVIGLQDLIGSLAGWFNIQSGSIFRVGDRVEVGGVQGDVIDISPVRTKVMEIGSGLDDDTWVRGRQYTGRIVAIANKATFVDPVFNYSASFEFIWEEVMIPIDYRDDWHGAERIMTEEAQRVSSTEEATQAIAHMVERYPLARTEVEPRVFINATDDYLELAARFVVPVRRARWVKDELTRRVLDRLAVEGIPIASTTQSLTLRKDVPPRTRPPTVAEPDLSD